MNEHFGTPVELPFDVRNRRFPITYRLDPGIGCDRDAIKRRLSSEIESAVQSVLMSEYEAAYDVVAALDVDCIRLLHITARAPWFSEPTELVDAPLDLGQFHAAVVRLLTLRVIRADINPNSGQYAYHWTYLGREVRKQLGIRSSAPAGDALPSEPL